MSVAPSDFWGEIGKTGIELGVVVIGGAVLTTGITALQTKHENRRQESESLRRLLLHHLIAAYNSLKAARRALRGAGLESPSGTLTAEQVKEFKTQMEALSDAELTIAQCIRQIETQPDVLANADRQVLTDLSQLEEYVRRLWTMGEQGKSDRSTRGRAPRR